MGKLHKYIPYGYKNRKNLNQQSKLLLNDSIPIIGI